MILSIDIRATTILARIWKWLLFHSFFVVTVYFLMKYLHVNISMATIISMIGIVLSILMGFRISSAYDRWWEARKIWGAVVNDSRTLARQLITFTSTAAIDPVHLQGMVHRHIAFVYAMAGRLRHQNTTEQIKPFVFEDEWHSLANRGHQPNLLLLHNLYAFKKMEADGLVSNFEFLALDGTMQRLTDSLGAAERIKNTPFPVPYSYFTSFLVHVFATMLPFGIIEVFGYIAIPIAISVIFIFLTIEQIAIEIQDPFANKENDIPVTAISQAIEIDLKEMLGDRDLPQKDNAKNGVLM
ncbi:hypothetical protein MUY27_20280 [Mucilaginibacter sp. RS28]|uniref:Bestrophin n=1 Tax=Mucilaginibacter straminoryzae TaxID=2932774 RepID=A0A9X1X6Y7_9SPHI|nr:bestrophin family ion channel [Mucilaginibacter straminoryzae]MCJ8212066.1 hypothetical protein [Mucilaginibacter straminoryzae]